MHLPKQPFFSRENDLCHLKIRSNPRRSPVTAWRLATIGTGPLSLVGKGQNSANRFNPNGTQPLRTPPLFPPRIPTHCRRWNFSHFGFKTEMFFKNKFNSALCTVTDGKTSWSGKCWDVAKKKEKAMNQRLGDHPFVCLGLSVCIFKCLCSRRHTGTFLKNASSYTENLNTGESSTTPVLMQKIPPAPSIWNNLSCNFPSSLSFAPEV